MKRILPVIISLFLFFNAFSQINPPPKRELTGVWGATYFSIDRPVGSQTPHQQKNALINLLDQHQATGIIVIYFQLK